VWRRKHDNMFSRFDTKPACDGRTDRRTDVQPIAKTCFIIADARKNGTKTTAFTLHLLSPSLDLLSSSIKITNCLLAGEASYCDYSMVLWEGFSTIAPAKMNGSEPNLAGRNYVTKGNHRKIWASIACLAPPGGGFRNFFGLLICRQSI